MSKTNDDIAKSIDALADMFAEHVGDMDDKFGKIDKRFEQIDQRFEQIDKRFEQVDQRFEQMDKRFDKIESRLGRQSTQITELQVSNAQIISRIDDIDGRLMTVENDIKEIYMMISRRDADSKKPNKQKSLEQQVLEAYQNIVSIAKEAGIKLPN